MDRWTAEGVCHTELGAASIEDLGAVELGELLRRLSIRGDQLRNEEQPEPNLSEMPTAPACECGLRIRREGVKNGKKWAAWMCAEKIKEHAPIWIDLEAEAEAQAIAEEGGPF